MHAYLPDKHRKTILLFMCIGLLLFVSACGGTGQAGTSTPSPSASPTQPPRVQTPDQGILPIVTPASTITPSGGAAPAPPTVTPSPQVTQDIKHPVLAFYYPWYTSSTWCSCTMSDLPTNQYNSSDQSTIARQVTWAANAGVTGFISSWWGPGDVTDQNFAKLLAQAATLQSTTNYYFASTIYFESDAPAFNGADKVVNALRYVISHYSNDPHFFHWHGKPVIFFWDPPGQGRTLSYWTSIRSQVDPQNALIWSAEGTDINLLSVFDGLHLFSGAYWGILKGDITTVDQGFRAQIDAYNQAHHTQKIWAAGVLPGYDDTRVPGRKGTYTVPRNNGSTYRESWTGALASSPDWVTVTSFNEWFEGSMIEPGIDYGNLYLDITQQFTKQW